MGKQKITIVGRHEIRNLPFILQNGVRKDLGEHRDFRRHPILEEFLPDTGRVSLSWTSLRPGQTLDTHVHPTNTMVIVCKGQGDLEGSTFRSIKEGDVVAIPAHCEHGFTCVGPDPLICLSVQFEGLGLYEIEDKPRVEFEAPKLEELMRDNEARLRLHIGTPFFDLLKDGTLADARRLSIFLRLLKNWSAKFQTVLHARTAFTRQESYARVFQRHFREEFGHDQLIELISSEIWDPIIESCSDWFINRMLVSENCERLAIVHLVLEHSAHEFHQRAHQLASSQNLNDSIKPYFEIHATHDEAHAQMGAELLEDITPAQMKSVRKSVFEAWDVLDAMLSRINELVRG